MSDSNKQVEYKQKKPKADDETKKNTQDWQLKQQLKKQKKPEQGQPQKKDKKNKNKQQHHQENKQVQPQKTKQKVLQKKMQAQKVQEKPQRYDTLKTVENCIVNQNLQLRSNRNMQQRIIIKSINGLLNKQDTVLLAGNLEQELVCQQIHLQGFNKPKFAQIVTHYEDISYFFDHRITKIFIEALTIFQNGSILAKRGTLNLVFMAKFNNIPIVAHGGSWNYCGYAPIDYKSLEEKYGPSLQQQYDWISVDLLTSIILEVGNTLPIQLKATINYIYRQYPLNSIQW